MKVCNKLNQIDYVNELKEYKSENLCVKDGRIVLEDDKKEGYLESCEIACLPSSIVVGCWACITSPEATIELMVKVCVDGVWSKYFTYGEWGLFRENYYYNDEDEQVRMYVDEIIMKDNKTCDKVMYKVILRKQKEESPKLSLICLNFKTTAEVETTVDVRFLPKDLEYDVPRLNQNMVPVIGHEMCSATTTAMLLKHRGLDFSKEAKNYSKVDSWGEYEHSYVASLVADPGHNAPTFGNWVFNTAVMGGYGFNAYVKRFTGWEELKYHLATVGPVGPSINGDTGLYKTGGHLLTAIGYKVVDGKEYVICNDPNINERFGEGLFVRYEYPLEMFMKFWRGMAYVIE